MNYMKELKAFREWVTYQEITTNAVALWHTLMIINNATGWKKQFNVPNITIEQNCRLTKQRLAEARALLVELGVIIYEPGSKGKAPAYEMVSIADNFNVYSATGTEEITEQSAQPEQTKQQTDEQSGPKTDDSIPKPNKKETNFRTNHGPYLNKDIDLNKDKDSSCSNAPADKNPFIVYEQNYGILRPISREALILWCEELGDDSVIHAIELAVKRGGRSFSYIEEILKDWSNAKLTSLDQVLAYEKQKADSKKKTISFQSHEKDKNAAVLAELREEARIHDAKGSS